MSNCPGLIGVAPEVPAFIGTGVGWLTLSDMKVGLPSFVPLNVAICSALALASIIAFSRA